MLAFVAKAIEMGRVSLALGTALQFKTALRQGDVIGEWGPVPPGEAPCGIMLNGRRWTRGLTWSDIPTELTFSKQATKIRAIVIHGLRLCPIVLEVLAHNPGRAPGRADDRRCNRGAPLR